MRRNHGEGAIYFEAARNRWVGSIDLPADGGQRRRAKVTGRTKTAVKEKLKQLQRESEQGLPVASGTTTFGQFLEKWVNDVVPARSLVKSQNTVTSYRWAVHNHLIPALGSKRLRALAPEDIERLLQSMADRGLAKSSIARVRMVAATALRHAQRRNLVARNAAELADLPGRMKPPKEGRALNAQQSAALLRTAAEDPVGPLVITGLMLGLRPGELCGLRWVDVDLEQRIVHVRQARLRVQSNGTEVLSFGPPKTKRSLRSIRLPEPVYEALLRQRAWQIRQRDRAGQAWTDLDLVFSTSVGTPMSPANLRRSFQQLTNAAGLGDWTPRELRHSAASLLSDAGVPMEEVMDLLGHVDTRMLERVYRHRVRPTVEAAAAPMEKLFGRGGAEL